MGRTAIGMLGLLLALGPAACAPGDIAVQPADAAAAQAGAEGAIAAADWSRVLHRDLRIRQSEFEPLVVVLRKGNAYILRLENGDDVAHSFRAPDFFRAIAVKSLTPAAEAIGPGTVLSAIDLAPRQTRALAFVPLRDGSFPFTDGWAGLLGATFGARGVVTIN